MAERASPVQFGREICGSLGEASEREWLVTNGIGGFASGTISRISTPRYHGVLVAALKPPLGRTLLVAKLEEMARYADQIYPLSTDRWKDGILDPQGHRHIELFNSTERLRFGHSHVQMRYLRNASGCSPASATVNVASTDKLAKKQSSVEGRVCHEHQKNSNTELSRCLGLKTPRSYR